MVDTPTGHANIHVDAAGDNNIVLYPGANNAITGQMIGAALSGASAGDFLLMQNETCGQAYAARTGKALGLRFVYAAAPFSAEAVQAVMDHIDLLVLNAVESAQLGEALGVGMEDLPIDDIVITLGAEGCKWVSNTGKRVEEYPAYRIDVIDTTGAGDTFTGYLVAALDRGMTMPDAIDLALRAGALMVSREGTADVIPDLKDIQDHDFSNP